MAFDKKLMERISALLQSTSEIEKKKMFGGICFMHRGNMLCGVAGRRIMVRVCAEQYDRALSMRHASVMDLTGKPLKGFIFVKLAGYKDARSLKKWINLGLTFTNSLPTKEKRPTKKSKKRVVVSADDNRDDTPLNRLINFGPVTLPELESIGFRTLGDLRKFGWEAVCRKWVKYFPERLNANAFIGIIATLEGIAWTKISPSERARAKSLVRHIKNELGLSAIKPARRAATA